MTPQVNGQDHGRDNGRENGLDNGENRGIPGDAGNGGNGGAKPSPARTSGRNTVFVFANLPHGQAFDLPQGRQVILEGWPVSELLGPHGERLPGGEFGVTEVPADHWEEVLRLYGEMTVLKSGLIFAASSPQEGQAMARERNGLRHGLEPVDPETLSTRPDLDNQPKQRRNAIK